MSLVSVSADDCVSLGQALLEASGADAHEALVVAQSLVDADLAGIASHGIGLLPMYLERIRLGSVKVGSGVPVVASSRGATGVIDAGHRLGPPVADFAMNKAIEKAHEFGVGVVSVRHAFHFGAATRYVSQAASRGCVGVAMCNTRPLMPAPGGAERLVGNNPLAIAVPTNDDIPVVVDLALSEAAMGKIRRAQDLGESIPPTWATDSAGAVTTDPAAAIEGMLLPVGSHKGFGLAFMIDLLVGGLSGGSWGDRVRPLYAELETPYDCSQLFAAFSVEFFSSLGDFEATVSKAADRIRHSRPAEGTQRLMTPGQPEWERRQANPDSIMLPESVVGYLVATAKDEGIDTPGTLVSSLSVNE